MTPLIIRKETAVLSAGAKESMPEAYTVSKLLSSINEVMAPVATDVCGSVTLQRKTENGIMLNTSEKEVAYLDMKARIKHSAQQVAQLDNLARAQWLATQRQAGNDAFYNGDYNRASEAYIEALTALDFGFTEAEKIRCQQEQQIPLTCNLAACMLMTEQWDKACLMCDQVLTIDPNCAKALQQRAKSKAKLAKFDDARADVHRAKQVICGSLSSLDVNDQLVSRLRKQVDDISRAERRHRHQLQQEKQFQRKMMQGAVGRLYNDKKEVDCILKADSVSNALHRPQGSFSFAQIAQSCGGLNAGAGYILAVLAMLINAISQLLIFMRESAKTS